MSRFGFSKVANIKEVLPLLSAKFTSALFSIKIRMTSGFELFMADNTSGVILLLPAKFTSAPFALKTRRTSEFELYTAA